MGTCMDAPKDRKGKKQQKPTKPIESSKLRNRSDATPSEQTGNQNPKKHEPPRPKYKKMTVDELLITYRIECTLDLSCKLQGPKYLTNIVDGSSKVMRVITLSQISEKRLDVFRQLLDLQIYQNDEGTMMILDQYCSGEDLYQLIDRMKSEKDQEIESEKRQSKIKGEGDESVKKDKVASRKESQQQQLLKFMLDIFKIVSSFHRKKTSLGNLNLSSFRKISPFQQQIQLVDFNLNNHVSDLQIMGFAHGQGYEADFQFLGYLLQFMLSQQPPIFLPHKMQYVEYDVVPYAHLIQNLLKGRACEESELSKIDPQKIIVNEKMSLGYRLRRDVNKLLKMRKKRKGHSRKFYGQDTSSFISEVKFSEEATYRFQTERILNRISGYIGRVRNAQEENFMNYSGNNQNLRRLKEVFLLVDADKKMHELKDCLSAIK